MSEKFDMHCVVELFGHSRIAGKVTEQAIGGATFIRVDVPKTSKREGFTRFYGASAIYSITPVDEKIAGLMADRLEVEPVSEWTLSLALRDKLLSPGTDTVPDGELDLGQQWPDEDDDDDSGSDLHPLDFNPLTDIDEDLDEEGRELDPGDKLGWEDDEPDRIEDKRAAAEWARELLQGEFVIVDVETTGLGPGDEIVQIGIIDQTGAVVLDQLIHPEESIPPDATAIHGMTDEMVKDALPFPKVYIHIVAALVDKRVVAYNLDFDRRMLRQVCAQHGLAPLTYGIDSACAMEWFAQFNGERNDYHKSYRWKKLREAMAYFGLEFEGQEHHAVADCKATLAVIRKMAEYGAARLIVPPATADEDRGGNTITVEGLEG